MYKYFMAVHHAVNPPILELKECTEAVQNIFGQEAVMSHENRALGKTGFDESLKKMEGVITTAEESCRGEMVSWRNMVECVLKRKIGPRRV